MLIIEDIDSLNIGIEKIEENLNYIINIHKSNSLTGQDQKDLKISIKEFIGSLNKLKTIANNYNTYDNKDQQKLMNVAYDLYNNVKYLKDILDQI